MTLMKSADKNHRGRCGGNQDVGARRSPPDWSTGGLLVIRTVSTLEAERFSLNPLKGPLRCSRRRGRRPRRQRPGVGRRSAPLSLSEWRPGQDPHRSWRLRRPGRSVVRTWPCAAPASSSAANSYDAYLEVTAPWPLVARTEKSTTGFAQAASDRRSGEPASGIGGIAQAAKRCRNSASLNSSTLSMSSKLARVHGKCLPANTKGRPATTTAGRSSQLMKQASTASVPQRLAH